MVEKALMVVNVLDTVLAKSEKKEQMKVQTNAIIHHMNNQTKVAIKELESIRLELDMIAKQNQNRFEQEVAKIIIKDNLSAQISQIITNLLLLKEYDKALEIAMLKPNLIAKNSQKLLS